VENFDSGVEEVWIKSLLYSLSLVRSLSRAELAIGVDFPRSAKSEVIRGCTGEKFCFEPLDSWPKSTSFIEIESKKG